MPARSDGPRGRDPQRPRGSRRSSRLGRLGSLRGGAGVGIIAGSAVIGTAVTIATRAQPGQVLSGCIVVGTVAAALAVRPRSGRLIFPVPALSYLIAALIAGIVYNRSTSKTALAIGATQWIANGFLLMALATVLAIVLITVRWYLGRGQPARDGTSRRPPRGRDEYGATRDPGIRGTRGAAPPLRDRDDSQAGPGGYGGAGYPAPRPQPGPRPQGPAGSGPYPDQRNGQSPGQRYGRYPEPRDGRPADQRPGPRADRRPEGPYDRRPESGPYNFSSGA